MLDWPLQTKTSPTSTFASVSVALPLLIEMFVGVALAGAAGSETRQTPAATVAVCVAPR